MDRESTSGSLNVVKLIRPARWKSPEEFTHRELTYILALEVYRLKNFTPEQEAVYDDMLLKLRGREEGQPLDTRLTALATAPLVDRCLAMFHAMGVFDESP